ncbi:MAG: MoaD/ThiS family protein [Bacillota bacterium]
MGFVYVELRGPLARQVKRDGSGGRMAVQADNGVLVREIIDWLAIPQHYVGLVVVNGEKAGRETPVYEGDQITFFPVVSGG